MPRLSKYPKIPDGTRRSAEIRTAWSTEYSATPPPRVELGLVPFTFWDGTTVPGGVNPLIHTAVVALDEVFETHRYRLDGTKDDWCYASRPISGTNVPSLHCWGIALDVNATTNPRSRRFKTDMAPEMIEAVQAIVFEGRPVWHWGGTWGRNHRWRYDPMHFQIALTPDEAKRFHLKPDAPFIDGDLAARVAQLERRLEMFGAVISGMDVAELAGWLWRGTRGTEPDDENVVEMVARMNNGVYLEQIFRELREDRGVLES